MSALISKLPEEIRIVAEKYRAEHSEGFPDDKTDSLIDAFDWSNTKEGFDIWDDIDENKYESFYEFHNIIK